MLLKTQLSLLIEIQKIDSDIKDLFLKKKELPEKIVKIDQEFQRLSDTTQQEKSALENINKIHRDKEAEFKQGTEKLKRTKDRLLEVKTNKEYQAMLKEIETIEQKNSQIEDEIIILLDKIEALKNHLKKVDEEFEFYRQQHENERTNAQEELELIDKKFLFCQEKSNDVMKELHPELLRKYEMIKGRNNGLAVVSVRKGICDGCHMNIRPQLYNDLQKFDQILACPNCQRIIYWDETTAEL
jgi:uncharacterized protein